MRKKKVLLLGKLPPPYMGPAIAAQIILQSDLKNRVDLFFLDTRANASIHTLGKWSLGKVLKNLSLYWKLCRMIGKHKPDLVLIPISQTTGGFIKDSIYILLARLMGKKVLLQLRGSNFKHWISQASGLTQGYVRFVLKRTEGIIVLGKKLKHLFEDYFPEEKIFVVPNGGDYNIPQKRVQSEELRMLYLSNLLAAKGIEDVFKAVEMVYRTHKNFSVDLIGDWLHAETKEACLALLENHSLPIRIHSPEESRNKLQYLADADIFVFPPREPEGHPWAIVEAMAAGLPVISTDMGAITESVLDGMNGFIVDPANPEQIAAKLQTLIADKSLRKKMGEESRRLYLNNFTEERMVAGLLAVIHQVTGE
jgi:glycosyltransferase involved in cell wall biosynthesis